MVFCVFRHAWNIVLIFVFNSFLLAVPKTVVITGGPGTGKSTTIRELAKRIAQQKSMSSVFFDEAATEVIKYERAQGNDKPWENLDQFQENILDFQQQCLVSVPADVRYAFFDRCFPDGLAYYMHEHKQPIASLIDVAKTQRLDVVFYLDFPLTRYDIDGIRHEDESEAKKLHERVRQAYEDVCGYTVIPVPPLSVEDRVTFILETLEKLFPEPVTVPKVAPLRVVITGGPCAGKTTTINALKNYLTESISQNQVVFFAEAASEIIKKEQALGNVRPWENRELFQQKILDLQLRHLALVPQDVQYAFFDRGIADGLAYFLHENKKPFEALERVVKNTKMDVVFLLDIPEFSYCSTDVRHEDQIEAKMLHERIRQVYEDMLGYKTIHVPVMSVHERVVFILEKLKQLTASQN